MHSVEFIQSLQTRGIVLSALPENKLAVDGADLLTDSERAQIRKTKPVILYFLKKTKARVAKKTRTDVEAAYPEIITLPDGQHVRLGVVLNHTIPEDWPDLLNEKTLLAFASALLIDGLISCDSGRAIAQSTPETQTTDSAAPCDGHLTDPLALLADLPLLPDDRRFIGGQLHRIPHQRIAGY